MRKTPLEIANPEQWLANLTADTEGLGRLVRESGGIACAAYRLARARCALLFHAAPQLQDLQAAAALLNARLGRHTVLPIRSLLPPPETGARRSSSVPAGLSAHSTQGETQTETAARSFPPPTPAAFRPSLSQPQAGRASL